MANCIGHERCPNCAKYGRDRNEDNLGVYDDGGRHCFSCGYHVSGSDYSAAPATPGFAGKPGSSKYAASGSGFDNQAIGGTPETSRRIALPSDSLGLLADNQDHVEGFDWLSEYQLTTQEITDNLLLFSAKGVYLRKKDETVAPLVIFPVYDSQGELLLWAGRNLRYAGQGTKWVLRGKKNDVLHGVLPPFIGSTCCVCEDIISAIKLGRVVPTYTLFGKSVSDRLLKYLSLNYANLIIFLDYDAIQTMLELQAKLKPFFESVRIVIGERDPKYYSTEELREKIR